MATSPMPLPPEPTLEQIFLAHRQLIERVAAHACRRLGFSREETEDFVSAVRLKILEDDYAVLRKHQGKSTLSTYLTVVVQRAFQDHLNQRWGKWRPSAEAERLGPLAIQLDRMLHRDGLPLSVACTILVTNHHVEATTRELEELAAKLPHRTPARPPVEGEEVLENRPASTLPPDEQALAQEAEARRDQVLAHLQEALQALPAEDALIARMSAEHKISQIARTLRLDQKALYRRRESILKTLRQDLERRGVQAQEIGALLSVPEDDHEPRD